MRCPNCKQILSDSISFKVNFCPICGKKLYDENKKYLLRVFTTGQGENNANNLYVFVDEKYLYEIKPNSGMLVILNSGFHNIKFRHNIRDKEINLLIDSDYEIKAYYNTLTGLIETNVTEVEGTQDGNSARSTPESELTKPIMVSDSGVSGLEAALGNDAPEYDIKATSGLRMGVLKLYSERLEFSAEGNFKKEIVDYRDIVSVKKKMGSIDVECTGNVHKVYSIPKDIYNEVIVFLNNKMQEVRK